MKNKTKTREMDVGIAIATITTIEGDTYTCTRIGDFKPEYLCGLDLNYDGKKVLEEFLTNSDILFKTDQEIIISKSSVHQITIERKPLIIKWQQRKIDILFYSDWEKV